MKARSVFVGWDPREETAWRIAVSSLLKHSSIPLQVYKLAYLRLQELGLYTRPTLRSKDGTRIIDQLSARPGYDGSCSTEHANARFFAPILAKEGLILFTDGDVLFRGDIAEVFANAEPDKALHCVQHEHRPIGRIKMDGQIQTRYERKNWSSFMLINCDHPANTAIMSTSGIINHVPGRELHALCWLHDDEIGSISKEWNYLEGFTMGVKDPKHVHFTEGTPDMAGYENSEYADEWFAERERLGLAPRLEAAE